MSFTLNTRQGVWVQFKIFYEPVSNCLLLLFSVSAMFSLYSILHNRWSWNRSSTWYLVRVVLCRHPRMPVQVFTSRDNCHRLGRWKRGFALFSFKTSTNCRRCLPRCLSAPLLYIFLLYSFWRCLLPIFAACLPSALDFRCRLCIQMQHALNKLARSFAFTSLAEAWRSSLVTLCSFGRPRLIAWMRLSQALRGARQSKVRVSAITVALG